METNQNITISTDSSLVTKTFEQQLFPTEIRTYNINNFDALQEQFLAFLQSEENQPKENAEPFDPIFSENDVVYKIRELVYNICEDLPEFNRDDVKHTPTIMGSQIMYQQKFEHIPLHAYEFVPLILTFKLSAPQDIPMTYFADTRGTVQTIRHTVSQNLVGTSFGLRQYPGEILVTPGYLQRYTETNLNDATNVTLSIKVGYASY